VKKKHCNYKHETHLETMDKTVVKKNFKVQLPSMQIFIEKEM